MKPEKKAAETSKNNASAMNNGRWFLENYWLKPINALQAGLNKKNWPPLFLELFIAISMSVAYYYLVQKYAVGVPNNSTNLWVFSSCSAPNFHLEQLYDAWKGRFCGLLFSGYLFDSLVKNNSLNVNDYSNIFALYQGLWLLLLFVVIILALRNSLLINLGIFAGLIYNFSPQGGYYFYSWDIPSTLFFTLAVLFYERRQLSQMIMVIYVGCFFKETVLVCALLLFFVDQWKWGRRFLTFAGIMLLYALGKKILDDHLHIKSEILSMHDATSLHGLLTTDKLVESSSFIFTPTLNHYMFVHAGTFTAVLVLGWQRRFLPYMMVILASVAGIYYFADLHEFRNSMNCLPLCVIILATRWQDFTWPTVARPRTLDSEVSSKRADAPKNSMPTVAAPPWSLRETFPILTVLAVLIGGVSVAIPAYQYCSIIQYQTEHPRPTVEALKAQAEKGDGMAQLALGKIYHEGQGVAVDNVEAYKWFKLAQLQGVSHAEKELADCAAAMSPEQITAAEGEVKQLQNGGP
jgi:hypothetical protein